MIPQNIIDDLTKIQTDVGALQDKQSTIPALQADVIQKQGDLAASQSALQTAQAEVTGDTDSIAADITKLQADILAINGGSPSPTAPPTNVNPPSDGGTEARGSVRHQVRR